MARPEMEAPWRRKAAYADKDALHNLMISGRIRMEKKKCMSALYRIVRISAVTDDIDNDKTSDALT